MVNAVTIHSQRSSYSSIVCSDSSSSSNSSISRSNSTVFSNLTVARVAGNLASYDLQWLSLPLSLLGLCEGVCESWYGECEGEGCEGEGAVVVKTSVAQEVADSAVPREA